VTRRGVARAATALALAALVAGAGRRPPASWERDVTPFPVTDSAGTPYDAPFAGGLDVPRPALVDIDGDGDLDLFIQNYTGRLSFYEQVREDGRRRFRWRTDRFQNLAIGEWYRFADLDGDGDLDLLSELPYSYIRFWRNDGGPRAPRFVAVGDTLRDDGGTAIFADRQNIAQLGDVDCDGKVDLLIGRVQGTITRYTLARFDSLGMPRFTFVTDHFEDIQIIGRAQGMHGANTMALFDLDGDGDLDLLWGDFFEPGLLFIENTGSCHNLNLRSEPRPWPPGAPIATSGYNAPTVGDLDGDGELDVLVGVLGGAFNGLSTSTDNLLHLAHTPAGWSLRTSRFLTMLDVGSESVPALADLDGDGDLDLVVGNRVEPAGNSAGGLYLFENTGAAGATVLHAAGRLPPHSGFQLAPAFGDLDGDGDLDLVLGGYGPAIALYRNEGSRTAPRFVLADTALVRIPRGSNTIPALADVDGDGDLDLVVGEASGTLNYFRNDGTRAAPAFTLVSERWMDIDVGRRAAPTFTDLDGDGDFDLVVGTDTGELKVFRNDGPSADPQFAPDGRLDVDIPPLATPAFGDLDGDGRPDLVVGTASGGAVFFHRR